MGKVCQCSHCLRIQDRHGNRAPLLLRKTLREIRFCAVHCKVHALCPRPLYSILSASPLSPEKKQRWEPETVILWREDEQNYYHNGAILSSFGNYQNLHPCITSMKCMAADKNSKQLNQKHLPVQHDKLKKKPLTQTYWCPTLACTLI